MSHRWPSFLSVMMTCLSTVALTGMLLGQGQDRGIITGLVTDKTGAAVPNATVTVTDEATSVAIVVNTTSAGNYSTPPLVLDSYKVQVEAAGFKTFLAEGVRVGSGATVRVDATLDVGQVSEKVEVQTSNVDVNVSTAEVSHVLGEKYYHDLPVVMGSDIRLAESLLAMQPGYTPMAPNGCAIFRGSQFQSRMNGGQTMAMENYLDGASFGSAIDHNNTQERSVPYDAVKEMKIIESNFSAQYGRTSGGFVEYTTKSGSSSFHGSAYDYYNYQGFNATGELLSAKAPIRKENWGFAVGGPIYIPKVYDGKKHKTFFFVDLDDLHYGQGQLPNFGNTNPLPSFLTGDFSSSLLLNTTTPVATDALGRPIYAGEIFNPATTRTVGGLPVRDGYGFDPTTGLPIAGQANIIPANDPLRSRIAAQLAPLIPPPDIAGKLTNNADLPSGNKYINPKTLFVRVDQSFGNLTMSTSVNANTRPSLRQCASFSQGCTFTNPATYFGEGFYQDITTRTVHQQFNWIIKPNLFNHTTLAFDRWVLPARPVSAGQHWVSRLGLIGPIEDTGGAPRVALSSPNIPYSHYGESDQVAEGCIANRWQFLDDVTWVKGKHTLKAGFEYRHHQFPFIGNGNVTGSYNFSNVETANWSSAGILQSASGDPVASFLLGQVDNANFNINFHHLLNEQYISPWVNDEFKATKNLTLTLGLRFDYQGCLSDAHGDQSSFDPNTPNPGAGGHLGAIIFAGRGPGRSGVKCFEKPPKDGWGPRLGFAYRVNNSTSIRGGYGIYYGGIPANQFSGSSELGFSTNPTVPNFTNGFSPAFYWDTGFPSSVVQLPPTIDPSIGNGTGPTWVTANSKDLPRYQNFSLTVEHQFGTNMIVGASYIGNHGTRLPSNAAALGLLDNMNSPAILTQYNPADLTNPALACNGTTCGDGVPIPYAGFVGDLAQALRPWPQFTNLNVRSVPYGYSIYNAFQIKLDKRFSNGFLGRIAYTNSKLINSGAEDVLAGDDPGIQNPLLGSRDDRSLSRDDVPQSLILAWSYELPFGKGKKYALSGPLDKIAGGWMIAATQRYDEGRPLSIGLGICNLCGTIFSNVQRPTKIGGGYGKTSGVRACTGDPASCDHYLLSSGWAAPDPNSYALGNEPTNDPHIRSFHNFNEDFSVTKNIPLTDRYSMKFESQMGNLFNRHLWCNPDTNLSDSAFGTVSGQCNQPRLIQFGLRLEF
ncbi:MAG TPA: carboxypeptidase-like regulatory domain-containing protein [Candidatus Sulfotelmatobacter sp.]|nr:carboxypeptidase-like regulatory domain-containing protein [Candidatus Sulfotelmatobacter sp.]